MKAVHVKMNENKLLIILFVWAFGVPFITLIISFIQPLFLPRYFLPSTVGLLIFLIYSLNKIDKKLTIIFFSLLFGLSLHYGNTQVHLRKKASLKRVVHEIRGLMKIDDLLYVTHEFNFHPVQYYLENEKNVFIFNKSYEKLPVYIGKILIPEDKVTTKLPSYPHKAFILYDDLHYEIKAMY